jgi:hypothetical protein
MAQLYRKSALEKISSPEQLDKALTVTSPMSWLALAAITAVIVATIIWSVLGTIPVTVTTTGIVASPVSTNAVFCPETGTIMAILVNPNSEIGINDPVASYKTGNGDVKTIYSDQIGTVTEIIAKKAATDDKNKNGQQNQNDQKNGKINQGDELLRISPKSGSQQVVVCYVDLADAKKIKRGMPVNISLKIKESNTYGHMVGRIINVDSYAASTEGMNYVLGSNNNVASTFRKDNKAVVAVTCELYPDPNTVSGYFWSNEKGSKLEVTNGTLVNAKVIVEEVHPITKLFVKLKDIWGD